MCGRYALNANARQMAEAFELVRAVEFPVRFNIAPTLELPVIRQSPAGERVADLLRWGLVPHWARDPAIGSKLNNARAETVMDKPSFRTAFQRRRCLVPMSGFYEWKTEGRLKRPHFIRFRDGALMAAGGLWEAWRDGDGNWLRSFCVITTTPNEVMAPIHERMPVFLSPEHYTLWLDPAIPGEAVLPLLAPFPPENMEAREVSRAVSNARNEGPALVEPLESAFPDTKA